MERALITVGRLAKASLVLVLALASVAILYLVVWKMRGEGPSLKLALLTVSAATYLWWLTERLLRLLGFSYSAALSLALSLTMTIWVLLAATRLPLDEYAGDMSESLWGWLSRAVGYILKQWF